MNTALCQLIGITLVEAKPVIRWEVEHRREVELEAGRQHAAWLWNFNVTSPRLHRLVQRPMPLLLGAFGVERNRQANGAEVHRQSASTPRRKFEPP